MQSGWEIAARKTGFDLFNSGFAHFQSNGHFQTQDNGHSACSSKLAFRPKVIHPKHPKQSFGFFFGLFLNDSRIKPLISVCLAMSQSRLPRVSPLKQVACEESFLALPGRKVTDVFLGVSLQTHPLPRCRG